VLTDSKSRIHLPVACALRPGREQQDRSKNHTEDRVDSEITSITRPPNAPRGRERVKSIGYYRDRTSIKSDAHFNDEVKACQPRGQAQTGALIPAGYDCRAALIPSLADSFANATPILL